MGVCCDIMLSCASTSDNTRARPRFVDLKRPFAEGVIVVKASSVLPLVDLVALRLLRPLRPLRLKSFACIRKVKSS